MAYIVLKDYEGIFKNGAEFPDDYFSDTLQQGAWPSGMEVKHSSSTALNVPNGSFKVIDGTGKYRQLLQELPVSRNKDFATFDKNKKYKVQLKPCVRKMGNKNLKKNEKIGVVELALYYGNKFQMFRLTEQCDMANKQFIRSGIILNLCGLKKWYNTIVDQQYPSVKRAFGVDFPKLGSQNLITADNDVFVSNLCAMDGMGRFNLNEFSKAVNNIARFNKSYNYTVYVYSRFGGILQEPEWYSALSIMRRAFDNKLQVI